MKHQLEITVCRISILLLISLLAACGGEDITDFIEPSDIRLSQLQVVSGGTLMLEENEVEEFDPESLGPYRVDLDDSNGESIELMVDVDESSSDASLQLIEVQKGEGGRSRVSNLTPGVAFSVPLDQGPNQIFIRVASSDTAARVDYTIGINRISSSAMLQDVEINGVLGSVNRNSDASFSPAFNPEVFEYDVDIDRGVCGVDIEVQPESRLSQVEVNGDEVKWLDKVFVTLQPGVTETVTVDVTSEDATESQTYTFRLTKRAESESERAADGRLFSLEVENARVVSEFSCAGRSLSVVVNEEDIASLGLIATLFTDQDGAIIRLGESLEDSLEIDESKTVETLTSGVVYSGSLLSSGLEEGNNSRIIEVTPANGNVDDQEIYQLVINLPDTREVFVDNALDLQDALRNAMPNDEIIVADGDYIGDSSESGNLAAHFFSDQSGTEEEPIILRAETSEANLFGSDLLTNSVLLLQGNNWEIQNISFSGAQNGVVFDGASNVILDRFEIRDVGERALVAQAGASNLTFDRGVVNQTGLSPEDRTGDGIVEIYGEGIVVGDGVSASQNVTIRRVSFGRDIANEAIEVKDLSEDVNVYASSFEFDNTLIRPLSDRSLILLAGGNTSVAYNTFEFRSISEGDDDLAQVVKAESTDDTALIELEQNFFDLDEQSVTLANNAGISVFNTIENQRTDGGDITTLGSVTTDEIPVYQIQSSIDQTQCVTSAFSSSLGRNSIELQECDAADGEQLWTFEHTDSGYVQMIQRESSIFSSAAPVLGLSTTPVGATVDPFFIDDVDNELREGYLFHWLLFRDGDTVRFNIRTSPGGFLIQVEPDPDDNIDRDNDLLGGIDTDGLEVDFILVRQ